jgi:PKD repeat protein
MRNQKSWKLLLLLLLFGIFVINFASAECTDGSCSGDSRYAVMHPDWDTYQQWLAEANAMPKWDATNVPNAASSPEPHPAGSYNLLHHINYVTADRNQGDCGDCWAWAGTGVMEINRHVSTNNNDRISVQWINSRMNNGAPNNFACCGGSAGGFSGFYTTFPNAIPWANTNAAFADGGSGCAAGTAVPWASITTVPNYPITSITPVVVPITGVSQATAIANIKAMIDNNRGVYFEFGMPNDNTWWGGPGSGSFGYFWNHDAETVVYDIDQFAGTTYDEVCNDGNGCGGYHHVLLVGYNDSVPGSEYWIILNSWGDGSGMRPNGTFRIPWNIDYSAVYPRVGGAGYYAFGAKTLDITWTPVANTPPNAEANGPYLAISGNPVMFSSFGSNDPDAGDTITYAWAFGNGASSLEANPNYIYPAAGHYTATLIVTDSHHWFDSDTAAVVVNQRPTADVNGPYLCLLGNPFFFSSVGSSDPDGDALGYEWSQRPTGGGAWSSFSSGMNPSITFTVAGHYDIRLRVTDEHGTSSTYSSTTAVVNQIPVAEANGPYSQLLGGTTTLSSAGSSDPDTSDTITLYAWDFTNDGSYDTTAANPSYAYPAAGVYTARLTVTDNHGASATDLATINVNTPPIAEANGPYTGSINQVITFSGLGSYDPDAGDSIASYSWNWGDGTAFGTGIGPTHAYTSSGTKTVTLTVTDNHGATGTDTATVTIRTPCQDITALKTTVAGMTLQPTIRNALNTRLNKASTLCAKGPAQYPAIATLFKKDFKPYVASKVNKGITAAQATTLIDQANIIIAACGG